MIDMIFTLRGTVRPYIPDQQVFAQYIIDQKTNISLIDCEQSVWFSGNEYGIVELAGYYYAWRACSTPDELVTGAISYISVDQLQLMVDEHGFYYVGIICESTPLERVPLDENEICMDEDKLWKAQKYLDMFEVNILKPISVSRE